MREKERVEREAEGSRRGRSRARSPIGRPHGYIHRVDQSAISFFVTNFPVDCNTEDLWKAFARYGRVGDVYIPSKVDKWGKRFAFVNFLEVKEVSELTQSMKE
ncbi:RNA recognition motif, partial [Trifolium medium]|nr:RNA recognition motif [Trifolium medium]